jgi:tape measure domain-containing protein
VTDPKIRYDIEAGITGEADVGQLASTVRSLGETLEGSLKHQAIEAANALDLLGARKDAVDNFAELRRTTEQLTTELNQATASIDRISTEMPQAAAATERFAQAEARARTALDGATADLKEQQTAMAALRQEYTGSARGSDAYREANAQLLVSVKDLRTNLTQKRTELAAASAATRTAETAERGLATEQEKTIASAKKLSGELGNKSRALEGARGALEAHGIATSNLASVERDLGVAIAQVRERVVGLAPAFAQAAQASSTAAGRQAADARTVRDGVRNIGDELRRIQTLATVAVGGGFLGGMVKDVAETADEFKNLQARIKLATGEGGNFDATFRGVTQVALATNSALEGTGTLFARLAKAGTDAGLSTQAASAQALGLTQTINQAVQLSGSSAESSAAAVTQLIQGLQSGVLRGEEFNSVMEQAPRLAQALAQGLNVTTGELRKMANEGALTSATVIKALTKQADTVKTEFEKLPPTVGRALQNLSTQWTLYVGASDNGMASSANVAKVIDGLAHNLDTLVSVLFAAGKAWAAIKIAGLAADVYRWATASATATAAVQANTAAVGVNTAAHVTNAAAQRASAAAGSAAGAAGGVVAAGATKASGAVGGLISGLARANIYLAVLANSKELGTWLGETAAKWAGYGKVIDKANESLRLQEELTKSNAAQQRAMALALEEARDKQFQLSKEATGLIGKFDEMRTKGDSAAEAVGKIGKDFDLASVKGIADASAVLDKLAADGKLTAQQFQDAWAQALKGEDLAVFETKARAAFAGTTREAERLAQVLDGSAREAIRRTGLEWDVLAGGSGKASRSAINDTEAIIASLDRLKAAGVDTSTALVASIGRGIETADSQKSIAALRGQIEAVRKQLGDKIADGLLAQLNVQADAVRVKLDQLKPGIQSVAEAMSLFGLKSAEALRTTAASSREAYDVLRNSGQATAVQLRTAFTKMAEDAIAANKGMTPSWLDTEDAILRNKEAVENFGQAAVDGYGKAGRAARQFQQAAENIGLDPRQDKRGQPAGVIPSGNQEIKSTTGSTREERLAGQNAVDNSLMFILRDKLKAGQLDAADMQGLKTVIGALKQNALINGSVDRQSAGAISLEGRRDDASWQATRRQFEDAVKRIEGGEKSTKHEVELKVPGGASDSFNMGSEEDAKKLIGLLGRAKGRSS